MFGNIIQKLSPWPGAVGYLIDLYYISAKRTMISKHLQ